MKSCESQEESRERLEKMLSKDARSFIHSLIFGVESDGNERRRREREEEDSTGGL